MFFEHKNDEIAEIDFFQYMKETAQIDSKDWKYIHLVIQTSFINY